MEIVKFVSFVVRLPCCWSIGSAEVLHNNDDGKSFREITNRNHVVFKIYKAADGALAARLGTRIQ